MGATLGQQSIKQRKQSPIASVRANYIAQGASQGEKLGGPESPAVDSYSHRAWIEVLLRVVGAGVPCIPLRSVTILFRYHNVPLIGTCV